MYQRKLAPDIRCPLEYGLELFGGKWKSRIICVLSERETLRYSTLRREMGNISDAVLASTLKELIRDGLVERRQFDEIPPHVEYSLSAKGASVVPILQSICRWAGAYHRQVGEHTPARCQRCDYGPGGEP
ncbi:winged helix-turn-helix transcriptional regulator [Feifania hominis]|uniref:Helix-turn-helix transcriptional regulator n=1 Tax=Feifania hominis TaxID=2763660 RepID=A0A926HUN4_9FIRM|nr:helix-turn-helix domain-containing protein [Feifania hominis]MBC8536478.1 helix-turn-helix transcriptional regulator [Feifania hominis]